MLNEKELKELDVLDWPSIAKSFRGSDLLLGNGFSRNISKRFRYDSLFDKFLSNCSDKDQDAFKAFKKTNFELILEELSNTMRVNKIFNIKAPEIKKAAQTLRDGLIKTIREIHPPASETDKEMLERIANQLNKFNDIFTLNYDLFLYWIIQIFRDKRRRGENVKEYCDYFYDDNYSERFTRFVGQKLTDYERYVYYLHGALFLFKEPPHDLKLRKAGSLKELVELIEEVIQEGGEPLFVSEGKGKDKEVSISRSTYLNFALDALKESERSLVIFGTSLTVDKHIVEAINYRKNTRKLAISIHVGKKSSEEIESELDRSRIKFPKHVIKFYNSKTLFKF